MVRKSLKKMECSLGFVQIPASAKSELIADAQLPCSTIVNGSEAKLDKFGRLWSSALKARFSIGTIIELKKTDMGYEICPIESGIMLIPPSSPAVVPEKLAEKPIIESLNSVKED